ncbi:MAG: exo-alpha-sialidase [bacterium]|nr:exo-alpha-sialidase [bacterium]
MRTVLLALTISMSLCVFASAAEEGRLMTAKPKGDPATEWKRSNPDIVVYLPKGGDLNDTDNEHFLVFHAPKSEELLAMWTQSSCEGHGDNHLVLARSADGEQWSEPNAIVGKTPDGKGLQASWGFPLVSDSGRIYCFFTKELPTDYDNRQGSGGMGCMYSDDNGVTWAEGADIPMQRNKYDDPDTSIPRSWIVWQLPMRDSKGRWLAGYTQCSSTKVKPSPEGWWTLDSRCSFMRFDNINEGPDPANIQISWLPTDTEGLEVPHRFYPNQSVCQEPSMVLLPDGRMFTTMRTMTGHVWYSVSDNDGETWREPEVLRYNDGGAPIDHPLSPCPIYALDEGRYLVLFHNNPGQIGSFNQFKKKWGPNQANYLRNPLYVAAGQFKPDAHQPIWFDAPIKLLDTDDIPVGPKGTAEIGTYTSMTTFKGKRVLWYPDRKYYLLGKYITDALLEGK